MWSEFWSTRRFCNNSEGMCENVTVWEWSPPVICVFSSCPLEHLALIYHNLSNITAGGFKGSSPKCTFLYIVQPLNNYVLPLFMHSYCHICSLDLSTMPLCSCWAVLAFFIYIFFFNFYLFSFAHSHLHYNWLLAPSQFRRRRLSKTDAHSLIDMWVLCFWNSTRSMSTPLPCYFWNSRW